MKSALQMSLLLSGAAILAPVLPLRAAPPALVASVAPHVSIPVAESSEHFGIGGGALLSGAYRLALPVPLSIEGGLGYSLLPVESTLPKTLHLLTLHAGPRIAFDLAPRLPVSLCAYGGYYYGITQEADGSAVGGGNPFLGVGTGIAYRATPRIDIEIGGAYRLFLGQPQSLLHEVAVSLGARYRFAVTGAQESFGPDSVKPARLLLSQVEFDDI